MKFLIVFFFKILNIQFCDQRVFDIYQNSITYIDELNMLHDTVPKVDKVEKDSTSNLNYKNLIQKEKKTLSANEKMITLFC